MKTYASRIAEENSKKLIKKIQLEKMVNVEQIASSFGDTSHISDTPPHHSQADSILQHPLTDYSNYESAKQRITSKLDQSLKNSFYFSDETLSKQLLLSNLELLPPRDGLFKITNDINSNDYSRRLEYSKLISFNDKLSLEDEKDCDRISVKEKADKIAKTKLNPIIDDKKETRVRVPLLIVQQSSCSYEAISSPSEGNHPSKKEGQFRNNSKGKASRNHSKGKREKENESDSLNDISIQSFNTDSVVDLDESFGELN